MVPGGPLVCGGVLQMSNDRIFHSSVIGVTEILVGGTKIRKLEGGKIYLFVSKENKRI